MAISTYSELRTELESYSGRGDVLAKLDTFIALAEEKIFQKLTIRQMETSATLVLDSGRDYTLPTDFIGARRVAYVSGSVNYPNLNYATSSALVVSSTTGVPSEYSISETLELNRPASGDVILDYYKKLTPLSSSNATNAALTNAPSVYLYGALAELCGFAEETEEEAKYRIKFMSAIEDANAQARAGRRGPGMAAKAKRYTP